MKFTTIFVLLVIIGSGYVCFVIKTFLSKPNKDKKKKKKKKNKQEG